MKECSICIVERDNFHSCKNCENEMCDGCCENVRTFSGYVKCPFCRMNFETDGESIEDENTTEDEDPTNYIAYEYQSHARNSHRVQTGRSIDILSDILLNETRQLQRQRSLLLRRQVERLERQVGLLKETISRLCDRYNQIVRQSNIFVGSMILSLSITGIRMVMLML